MQLIRSYIEDKTTHTPISIRLYTISQVVSGYTYRSQHFYELFPSLFSKGNQIDYRITERRRSGSCRSWGTTGRRVSCGRADTPTRRSRCSHRILRMKANKQNPIVKPGERVRTPLKAFQTSSTSTGAAAEVQHTYGHQH